MYHAHSRCSINVFTQVERWGKMRDLGKEEGRLAPCGRTNREDKHRPEN